MEKYESIEAREFLKLQSNELPKDIFLTTHERALRNTLLATRQNIGTMETVKAKAREAVGIFGAAFRSPVFKPALAIITVFALAIALVPVLTNERQGPVNIVEKLTASQIALADPQVRATFSNEDLSQINVREMDGSNGQKVVLLTCNAAMVAVSVDIVAKKISEWLLNIPSFQPALYPPGPYQVIFQSQMNGSDSIYIVNTDGSSLTKITDNAAHYADPDWSFQSQKLVLNVIPLDRSSQENIRELYTMFPASTDLQVLAPLYDAYQAEWSPDGTKIAFAGRLKMTLWQIQSGDMDYEIFVLNADGSNLMQLTDNYLYSPTEHTSITNDFNPQWSPDGNKIAFESLRDGNWEIYVMNADGTDQKNLTNNPASELRMVA
jgi:Tol biopolymer transport system component